MFKTFQTGILVVLLAAALPATAAVAAIDDAGREFSLLAPARRIISLAPHATELLFAAGAGSFVVGASQTTRLKRASSPP
jgi:iron complex transport system substrate-binding protein